jgi:hypothetical protein
MALAAPARLGDLHQNTQRELAKVVGLLQEHCELAEREGGLITEVVHSHGRSGEVTEAQREHERLLKQAVSLLAALEPSASAEALSQREVRRRAWELTAALRKHQARETDLLFELLDRDEGLID